MIYFIRSRKFVKIGYSKNPEKRLRELQTGNQHRLKLVGTLPGTYITEKAIHENLAKWKSHGEWFHVIGPIERMLRAFNDPHNRF